MFIPPIYFSCKVEEKLDLKLKWWTSKKFNLLHTNIEYICESKVSDLEKYHMMYFDWLASKNLTKKNKYELIAKLNAIIPKAHDCYWDPYPTSMRLMNLMKYDNLIDISLSNEILLSHFKKLIRSVEYDIDGNHLFENLKALYLCALLFNIKRYRKKFSKLLVKIINQQIVNNFHYENSPSYHGLFLEGLVDLAYALKTNETILNIYEKNLYDIIVKKLPILAYGFSQFFDQNREMARFNDNIDLWTKDTLPADDLIKSIDQLTNYYIKNLPMINSFGSFIIADLNEIKLIINTGKINCMHTPGHTHSDIGSFSLFVKNNIIINNLGCSTYEDSMDRKFDRSWVAKSTFNIIGAEIHETWGSFRVARESESSFEILEKSKTIIINWKHYTGKYKVKRTFQIDEKKLHITDLVTPELPSQSMLHLSSVIKCEEKDEKRDGIILYSKRNVNIGCDVSFKNLKFRIKENKCYNEIGKPEKTRTVETTLINDKLISETLLDIL